MAVRDDAEAIAPDLVRLRRAIHREPEIGLHLPATQAKVLAALDGLPLEVTVGSALSSVTAVLRGGGPAVGGPAGPVVLLRGDMDALPVTERTGLDYASRTSGAMHACGHDLHTAMLAGAARLLAARQRDLPGTVVFMFQPGEEGQAGARHMIEEGVLDAAGQRPAAAYALHVMSAELPGDVVFMFQPGEEGWDGAGLMVAEGVLEAAGRPVAAAYGMHVLSSMIPRSMFATRPGPLMAASDGMTVVVRGEGGHGSAPHRSRDPITAAAEMVTALLNRAPNLEFDGA